MKTGQALFSILLLAACIGFANAASLVTATSPLDASSLVYVSGYEINPQVLYPYETGTVTIHVTNAANASVVVSQPDLIDEHLNIKNSDSFSTTTSIGPGATADFSYLVTVDATDGTYFPLFTVSTTTYGAKPIHAQIKLKVDSTDVRASISKKPDTFSLEKKDTVNVSVINPRVGDISNVLIVATSPGSEISPSEKFVGSIPAGSSASVPFDITPHQQSDVTFNITFRNGDNIHATSVVLPLTIGEDKTGAQIVVNNIASSGSGNTMTLKGDVTNNGLTDAKSVLVTVESPATPVNPNPVYAIGNLEPDDFSSFEVSYTMTGPGAIPLSVEYKDENGNVFRKKFTINTNDNTAGSGSSAGQNPASGVPAGTSNNRRGGIFGSFGSGFNQIPVTEIVIGILAVIAIIIAWKKGLLRRIADKFRKKTDPEIQQQDP